MLKAVRATLTWTLSPLILIGAIYGVDAAIVSAPALFLFGGLPLGFARLVIRG